MNNDRLEWLATDLWDETFAMLDSEIDMSSEDAGKLAQAAADGMLAKAHELNICECTVGDWPRKCAFAKRS